MRTLRMTFALCLLAAALPSASHAGVRNNPVPLSGTYSVATGKGSMSGNFYDIYHSGDASYFSCSFTRADSYTYLYCDGFTPASGQYYDCFLMNPDPGFVAAFSTISYHADVAVGWINGSTCSSLSVGTDSTTQR